MSRSRPRLVAAAVALVAAFSVLVFVSTSAGNAVGKSMRKGTVYHLQLIRTNATIFTSNGTSGSPGDYEVATGPLVSASTHQRVGGAYEVYMLMKRANKSFPQQCVGTLRLRHGDITFQGILLSAAGNISGALAVTGGTGRYRLARGTVTETILGDGTHLAVDIIS